MILKGSQRGGPRQLAVHLMNVRDNDHVTIPELRGFVSDDLFGALAEAQAVSKGTKCRQPVFSLSLNPPKGAQVDTETFIAVADRAEEVLGLKDHPRAIVIHEKDGRKHAHVVWSRIDLTQMKAVNHSHFKMKLNALSKELYLEHGWELPEGHKTNGWKNPLNFSLAEWQQAKRLDLDPREIKQVFQNAWQQSDNLPSFRNALEEHGYYLAKGDRRGIVALDLQGEVYSVARWTGIKTKDMESKLGKGEALPGVDQTREALRERVTKKLRAFIKEDRQNKQNEVKPLTEDARRMTLSHRAERLNLQDKQDERLRKENKERAARFKRGLGAVLDLLTGRLFEVRKGNEQEAYQGYLRDRAQREQLFSMQLKEREAAQKRIDVVKTRHRQERMQLARQISEVLRLTASQRQPERQRGSRKPGLEFDR